MVDAGNTLFQGPVSDEPLARKKAQLLVETMGALHTAAMAVGTRDLAAGIDFIRKLGEAAKLPLLSANLVVNGKHPFKPSTVVAVGPWKVGLIGVGPLGVFAHAPGAAGEAPVPAAIAEAKKLRARVDLVIVLAAVPYADALQLSKEGGSNIDLVLQSGDSRGGGVPQSFGGAYVISTGERGRTIERIDLDMTGKGPIVDAGELPRTEARLPVLAQAIANAESRMKTAPPDQKAQLSDTLERFKQQKVQVTAELEQLKKRGGRGLSVTTMPLDARVKDEPALKAKVDRLAP